MNNDQIKIKIQLLDWTNYLQKLGTSNGYQKLTTRKYRHLWLMINKSLFLERKKTTLGSNLLIFEAVILSLIGKNRKKTKHRNDQY